MNKFNVYKGKNVLITGHTGFNGSWLSLLLKKLGANVIGYSLGAPTQPSLFESINLQNEIIHHIGDVRDEKFLTSIFKKHQPEFVFHLAAQSLVRFSYREPKLTYETNIMGTTNVLEAVKKTKSVKVCIIATSDKCYENNECNYGYKETDRIGGGDPYSSSKGCAELITASYRRSFFNPKEYDKNHKVALASVRAGNMIGGGDWARDRLIPDCIRALSQNETIIIRNPQATRPWQYVLDPLAGYLLLGALMLEDGPRYSSAWNFGPEEESPLTVEELVKFVIKLWDSGSYMVSTSTEPYEAKLLKLDVTKARMVLGWQPLCGIYEAIEKTIKWYKNFYNAHIIKNTLYEFTIREIRNYMNRIHNKSKDVYEKV